MKKKTWPALLLAAAVAWSAAAPSAVSAAQPNHTDSDAEIFGERIEEPAAADGAAEALPAREELLEGYLEGILWGNHSVSTLGSYGGEVLEGVDLQAYQTLKAKLQKIAAGEIASSVISLSLEDLGITKTSWTAEELGVDAIVRGGAITDEAVNALTERISPEQKTLMRYLLMDCPLDLYWYDKTAGAVCGSPRFRAASSNGVWTLSVAEGPVYRFSVAEEYQDISSDTPMYTVNASAARTAQSAAANAAEIVAKYAGCSDYEKLAAYRQEICSLVSYNYAAAEQSSPKYGNPWQLIWVFDGDSTTNVVCEGYAKAFQYLCDLTDFRSPSVACYSVNGVMSGGTGAGAHMWNIVTMNDRKNYIVDVTNCDTGSVGADDRLFLAGARGSAAGGYIVTLPGGPVGYVYDPDMSGMYGAVLEIAPSGYEPAGEDDGYLAKGTFGTGIEWTLDTAGCLELKGTGAMPDGGSLSNIPWHEYRADVKKAVVGEGITGICSGAFSGCSALLEAEIPDTVTQIGDSAFDGCSSLGSLVLPEAVTRIGNCAFQSCTSLKDIWFLGECPSFAGTQVFSGDRVTIHTFNAYQAGWQKWTAAPFAQAEITWDFYCPEHIWEDYAAVDQAAGCTETGRRSVHCRNCDAVKAVEVIPAAGHRYETTVQKATTSEDGLITTRCTICRETARSAPIYAAAAITLSKTAYTYTGSECRPSVTVTDKNGAVILAEHYTVSYSNHTAVGTASVSVVFKGNYSGTLTGSFRIQPKGTSLTKVKAASKGLALKWKKQAAQTTGYQIQYSANRNFKGAGNIKISKNKTVSAKVSKLKAKKKYYVRIRTYKTVKGTVYYSAWSKVKSAVTRK